MKLSDFDFDLPADRIAQRPCERRDGSRLMLLDRRDGPPAHHRFADLDRLLRPGDLLVFNDTRVRPARLRGRKASGGRVELLLLEPADVGAGTAVWRCLLDASRKPAPGSRLDLDGGLEGWVEGREGSDWRVRIEAPGGDVAARIEQVGKMPLPPYIRREDDALDALDRRRYQTIYARRPGAVAAPTAGLHFTSELLDRLRGRGVEQARLTLHVGRGTFLPVRVDDVEEHRMHGEWFELPQAVAEAVRAARARGGRVLAVGTTVVRTLEARAEGDGGVAAGEGWCDLFIYPGHRFRVVDGLITNFHLPRSTLLMLVGAFTGTERLFEAYRAAIAAGYRFYSYGDAMLVLDDGA